MSNEVKIELTASESKLISSLRAGEAGVNTFGRGIQRVFSTAQRSIDAASKTFGTFGKAMTALGSGLVLKKLFSLDEFTAVDDALLMMQANLKMTGRELEGFKSKLSAMAGTAGEDMGELFKLASKFSKAYNPEDILKIVQASSAASHAMEQDLTSVSDRIVQIMKMYKKSPDEARNIANSMVASNADADTLNTLLQRGILKGGAGKSYQEVLAIAGALRKVGAESPRVVVAIEAMLNAIEDKEGLLQRAGIKLFKFDPASKQKVKKDITEILSELGPALEKEQKRLGKDKFEKALDEAFGAGAHEALPFLIAQLGAIKKAKEEQANAGEIAAARLAKAEEKWGEQFSKIKGNLAGIKTDLSFIYDLAKKPVKFMADSPGLTKGLGYGAAGLSLALLGGMAGGKAKEFLKNYRGTAVGVAEGMALESMTGVKSVFVVNWPGSLGGFGGKANGGFGTRDIDFTEGKAAALSLGSRFFTNPATLAIGSMAIPAYIVSRMEQEASAGLRRWRSENPYDYEKSKEIMSGRVTNHITMSVAIDQKTGRVTTNTNDLNTTIDIPRGDLR